MWSVTVISEHANAGEGNGDRDLLVTELIPRCEHLLSVASELLARRDEALFGLRLIDDR